MKYTNPSSQILHCNHFKMNKIGILHTKETTSEILKITTKNWKPRLLETLFFRQYQPHGQKRPNLGTQEQFYPKMILGTAINQR